MNGDALLTKSIQAIGFDCEVIGSSNNQIFFTWHNYAILLQTTNEEGNQCQPLQKPALYQLIEENLGKDDGTMAKFEEEKESEEIDYMTVAQVVRMSLSPPQN